MRIHADQYRLLSEATFYSLFRGRLAMSGDENTLPADNPEIRSQIWRIAQSASEFGIRSIHACLIYTQLHWEFGLDCMTRIPAFNDILRQIELDEATKIDRLWLTRCAIFDALAGK